jgi:hypothetical protein
VGAAHATGQAFAWKNDVVVVAPALSMHNMPRMARRSEDLLTRKERMQTHAANVAVGFLMAGQASDSRVRHVFRAGNAVGVKASYVEHVLRICRAARGLRQLG